MIKAAFFDIDGTLLPFHERKLPESTVNALDAMREKGVLLFIATGRCPSQLEHILKLVDYPFDGMVMMNGQYCTYRGELIYSQPLTDRDFSGLRSFHKKNPTVLGCVDELLIRYHNKDAQTTFANDLEILPPFEEILEKIAINGGSIYQISAKMGVSEEHELLSLMPDSKIVRWHPEYIDVIPKDGGKDVGIARVLSALNIPISKAVAFGDGGNDIAMIKSAGIGIAMGNASEAVKQSADYVTTSADDDGIYNACKHFAFI